MLACIITNDERTRAEHNDYGKAGSDVVQGRLSRSHKTPTSDAFTEHKQPSLCMRVTRVAKFDTSKTHRILNLQKNVPVNNCHLKVFNVLTCISEIYDV